MLFNSFSFLVFFPITVLLYFCIPKKLRYVWLLIASYYFYMCWNPKYVVLLLFSTAVTYSGGLLLEKIQTAGGRKAVLAGTILLNLAVLFFFKYADFALANVNALLGRLGISTVEKSFDLLLPVGISFYTFQALGYTIDVYRKETYAEKNFLRYALFVSFFPQLVAGPIERSKNLLKQLNKETSFDYLRMRRGILIMLWGYFLKLMIADRAAIFVNAVYGNYVSYGGVYIIAATLLFAVQIYCDFAGYSTIARGAALVMGFELMENFEAPYFSKSVAEFWKRWHISLSGWFRDYLYIPLGGNRKGEGRRKLHTMLVFLASGLWHGASWNFIVWGGLNGLFQLMGKKKEKQNKGNPFWMAGKTIITFLLVDFTWLFFRADSLTDAFAMIKSAWTIHNPEVLGNGGIFSLGLNCWHFLFLLLLIVFLWAVDFCKYRKLDIVTKIEEGNAAVRFAIYAGLLCGIVFLGIYGVDYEASQFIYFQF